MRVIRLKPPKHNIGEKYYTRAENYEITKVFEPSEELKESEKDFKIFFKKKEKKKHYCPICGKEVTKKVIIAWIAQIR